MYKLGNGEMLLVHTVQSVIIFARYTVFWELFASGLKFNDKETEVVFSVVDQNKLPAV